MFIRIFSFFKYLASGGISSSSLLSALKTWASLDLAPILSFRGWATGLGGGGLGLGRADCIFMGSQGRRGFSGAGGTPCSGGGTPG